MTINNSIPSPKPWALFNWVRRQPGRGGSARGDTSTMRQLAYGAAAETWLSVRWLGLKAISLALYVTRGRTEVVERKVIEIGNRIFPSKYRLEMFDDFDSYISMMDFGLDDYLALQPPETWLLGKEVLDIGSGLGQYSNELCRRGAKHVTGLEYQPNKAAWAASKWHETSNLEFIPGSAEELPFADASFDSIFSHTVFEHINDVPAALREVRRVLRPNGAALLSYNYFHHRGGHHLFPYVSFPWATWVVSERTLCRYWSECLHRDQSQGRMGFHPAEAGLESLSAGAEIHLNKLNFDQFEQSVHDAGLQIRTRRCSEDLGRLLPPLLWIPGLKYFLSGTVYYELVKTN